MKNKKRYFFWDALGGTIFLLLIMGIVSVIPFGDVFNPVEKMLGDFQLTDVVFSQLRTNPDFDDHITVVNIGNLDREGIAEQINIINKYNPKVIGIDAFFRKPKSEQGDSALRKAFSEVKNLVLVSELIEDEGNSRIDTLKNSHPMFMQYAQTGFADMVTEGKDVFKTSRICIPKDIIDNSVVPSFPTKLAQIYNPAAANLYLNRNKDTEVINFRGNIDTRKEGVSNNSKGVFYVLDVRQVLDEEFDPSVIKDKIVIMGFLGADVNENVWTDKFFTPLNANYIGKTYPDMYGVIVHANIVSMILAGSFIDEMPEYLNTCLSLILIFLNIWFLTCCFFKLKEWYDGGSNIIVLVEALILMFIVVLIFNKFNYKFDISLVIVALFLSGNMIEIYHGVLKLGFNTIRKKFLSLKGNKSTSL
ncbi:MAG TPA: CHASE2 domain-containing protein [Cytophagaceae bacterium]